MEFLAGQTFQQQFEITSDVYDGFVSTFNDKNPLHTNNAFAREKGYREKVMHGNILNGFISFFVGELLPIKNVVIFSQDIKFKKPVYLNDTLTLDAEVCDFFESVKAAEIKFNFRNQNNIKVALGRVNIGLI